MGESRRENQGERTEDRRLMREKGEQLNGLNAVKCIVSVRAHNLLRFNDDSMQ